MSYASAPDRSSGATGPAEPTANGSSPPRVGSQPRSRRPALGLGRFGPALGFAYLGMVTLGFNSIRAAALSVSDLCFAASAAFIISQLLSGRDGDLAPARMRRTSPLVLAGALLLMTGGAISSFASWDAFGSMQVVLRFIWLTFVWFWILRSVARDRRTLELLAKGWRVGVLISAALGAIGQLGVLQIGTQNSEGRQTGFFGQPNEYAALLAIGLPLLILDTPSTDGTREGRRSLPRRFALVGIVLFAISSSGSMTATFSAVVGCVAAGTMMLVSGASKAGVRRARNPVTGLVVLVIAGVGLFYLSTSDLPVVDRFTRYQSGDSYLTQSVGTREDRNERAIAELPNTLLVGTGLQLPSGAAARVGQAASVDPDAVQEIHNMFLKIAHEAGVPALVGLLIMVLATLNQCWRLTVNTRGTELDRLAAALFGANIAGATQGMFHPIVYQRYFWIAMAMTSCLWAVRRQELRAALNDAP